MDPITFRPLYMERVWGGRELARIYGRTLPDATTPYGEAWEIVDRENEQSVVAEGIYQDFTLHELWTNHREEIFGDGFQDHLRFPILIKVLDARENLSVQVHPPADLAEALGGEPKTEMWFIADCDAGAKLYVGLKKEVTREGFKHAVVRGTVADCIHAIEPKIGESIFIASGRLHAIGAGFLIHEIQQNSDTTYRVFDWNRLGLDGNPRELHYGESLSSINFTDFEPTMDRPVGENLATCDYFKTDKKSLKPGETLGNPQAGQFSILSVVEGQLVTKSGRNFDKGSFILLPQDASPLESLEYSTILQITLPK